MRAYNTDYVLFTVVALITHRNLYTVVTNTLKLMPDAR